MAGVTAGIDREPSDGFLTMPDTLNGFMADQLESQMKTSNVLLFWCHCPILRDRTGQRQRSARPSNNMSTVPEPSAATEGEHGGSDAH